VWIQVDGECDHVQRYVVYFLCKFDRVLNVPNLQISRIADCGYLNEFRSALDSCTPTFIAEEETTRNEARGGA